ncbi:MAG: hypothetical protein IPJ78_07245 [Gemmatimonadetes bacterium]|nr:hypothetical protein [Gemmatimonadota bacterium]
MATALAEIIGRYLPYVWLSTAAVRGSFCPAAGALAIFVCGCSISTTARGRVFMVRRSLYDRRARVVWLVDG